MERMSTVMAEAICWRGKKMMNVALLLGKPKLGGTKYVVEIEIDMRRKLAKEKRG
jgi:hypothetical protein